MFKKTLEQLIVVEKTFRGEIEKAMTSEEAEKIKKEVLGKGGELTKILKTLGQMVPEERKVIGFRLNDLKREVEESYKRIIEKIKEESKQ